MSNLETMLREVSAEKPRRKPQEVIGYTLLFLGIVAIVLSFIWTSFLLAFIGLGLTFWSVLLAFLKTTKYVKADVFEMTPISSLKSVDQIIQHFNCKGRGVYLPKRYLKESKGGIVFVPLKDEMVIPPVEEVAEEKVLLENPRGICLTPSGLSLVNLFERKLRTDFSKVDVDYLVAKLPKLFIEDLEIAEDFEMNYVKDMVHVRITGSIYENMCREVRNLLNVCRCIGCPLCSSIACSLAKSTGKPIVIEKSSLSKKGKVIQAYYRIIENEAVVSSAS